MKFFRLLVAGVVSLVVLSGALRAETELYSCKLAGSYATYNQAEINAVIAAGGECTRLAAGDIATCTIGGAQQQYARRDVERIQREFPDAVCQNTRPIATRQQGGSEGDKRQLAKKLYVYFKSGAVKPTIINQMAVVKFAREFAGTDSWYTITAYADRAGDQKSNHLLSVQRAAFVKKGLLSNGIRADAIVSVSAMGENAPPVDTVDGERLANNRVVVVRAYR